MAEKPLTVEEKCAVWGSALAVFGETIERLANKIVLTLEEKQEMKTILRHAEVALKAAREACTPIIERR